MRCFRDEDLRALPVPGAAGKSRSELKRLEERARGPGLGGLVWAKLAPEGVSSPIAKSAGEISCGGPPGPADTVAEARLFPRVPGELSPI